MSKRLQDYDDAILSQADYAYAALAAAVIKSAERDNDQTFLKSEWCANLREIVRLAMLRENNLYDKH